MCEKLLHKSNLLPAVKCPLIFVQTVSILCTCFSVSADIVQFVYTRISVVGRLVADGTVAPPITALQERQQGSLCCIILQTGHGVVSLLPNMQVWSFIIPSSVFPSFFSIMFYPTSFLHWFLHLFFLPFFGFLHLFSPSFHHLFIF